MQAVPRNVKFRFHRKVSNLLPRESPVSEKLARTLVEVLIDNAFPARDLSNPSFVSFFEVAEMFFNSAPMVKQAAEETGHAWWPGAVQEADDWLTEIAEDGAFTGERAMKAGVAEEIWRRWQHVTSAAILENEIGKVRPALTLPANTPGDLKAMAVMIYFLAGEGRDYSGA